MAGCFIPVIQHSPPHATDILGQIMSGVPGSACQMQMALTPIVANTGVCRHRQMSTGSWGLGVEAPRCEPLLNPDSEERREVVKHPGQDACYMLFANRYHFQKQKGV